MRFWTFGLIFALVGCAPSVNISSQTSTDMLLPSTRADLSENVPESSGLAYHLDRFWTINDGGNSADIFWIDDQGKKGRVPVKNAANLDWETLTTTSDHLVIGDCGNNLGDRIWFQLHRITWSSLSQSLLSGDRVQADTLNVKLGDVTPSVERQRHNRDCEALVTVDHEYWLFTKNWDDQRSRLYRIDANTDKQTLYSSAQLDVGGLITGADYDPDSKRLALIGYGAGLAVTQPFVWIIPVIENDPAFDQAVRYRLNKLGQWEAILWHNGALWVSRETSILGDAVLAEIELPVNIKTNK